MKLLTKLKNFMLLAVLTMTAVSCEKNDNPDNDTITQQTLGNCYAVFTTPTDAQTYKVATPITFNVRLNYTRGTSEISITGLAYENAIIPMLTLYDVPWMMNPETKWATVSAMEILPKTNAGNYKISNFTLSFLDRLELATIIDDYDPAVRYSFTLTDLNSGAVYNITGSRGATNYAGYTTSTLKGTTQEYKTHITMYDLSLNFKTMQATLYLKNAKFIEGMPAMNMVFSNIPFSFAGSPNLIAIEAKSIIPEVGGTPMPGFPVTNFSAILAPGSTLGINFDCTPSTMPGVFEVKASLNPESYTLLLE